MYLVSKADEIGKPAWIVMMILGFVVFWPVGLGILAFLIWSGRMACWKQERAWNGRREGGHQWRWQEKWERKMASAGFHRSSGNSAFDEYRAETLRRLEDEEREFSEFLERLRFAKDKAEFDEFLNQRRGGAEAPPVQP